MVNKSKYLGVLYCPDSHDRFSRDCFFMCFLSNLENKCFVLLQVVGKIRSVVLFFNSKCYNLCSNNRFLVYRLKLLLNS